ncbi:MAG: universal stress protein [Desulfatitalea sp.]
MAPPRRITYRNFYMQIHAREETMPAVPQKILIAIDDSENAQRSVQFVAKSFSIDNQVTLFSVVPDTAALCKMDSPELTPLFKTHQASFCILEDKKRELVKAALKKAKETLVAAGFSSDRVVVKIEDKKHGADGLGVGQHGGLSRPVGPGGSRRGLGLSFLSPGRRSGP